MALPDCCNHRNLADCWVPPTPDGSDHNLIMILLDVTEKLIRTSSRAWPSSCHSHKTSVSTLLCLPHRLPVVTQTARGASTRAVLITLLELGGQVCFKVAPATS